MFWAAHITSTTGVLKCRNLKKYSYTKVLRTCRLGRVVRMQFRTQLWAGMVRFTTLHGNLWGEGDTNPGSTNKDTKFGQLIIKKIIKILSPDVTF